MGLFYVPESLVLTITFAALSGLFLTLATAATAYPAHIDRLANAMEGKDEEQGSETFHEDGVHENELEEVDLNDNSSSSQQSAEHSEEKENEEDKSKNIKRVSQRAWRVAYIMNLLCAAIGGIITLVGTWFGPVSLFVPIKQVCQIISGMIIFSYVLKTEPKPSKDTSVGNYIIMLSAIMLIFVGPEIRDEPIDVDYLFSKPKTDIFAGIVLLAFVITFPFQFLLACTNVPTSDRVNFIFLLLTESLSSVVGNSTSKLIPLLEVSDRKFILNLVLLVLAIFTVAFSSVLRSTVVKSQVEYLPLMLSGNIFLNGIVGLVLWEDKIINTGGYTCIYFFFVMGIYLVSDYGYEILPGTTLSNQTTDNPNVVVDGLIHGRARIIHSERMNSERIDASMAAEESDRFTQDSTYSILP